MPRLDVITTETDYQDAVHKLASGSGPIAIDAERASGFRYSQRAYLIQIYREGSGTFLFDPPEIGDFSELQEELATVEWIFHAASQDLACLREVGLDPVTIFDTELAGRLLGMPRVALGTVVEELLGIHLKKEHSAADWSTRPLPESWLEYAALDVELLIDLRNAMADLLEAQQKTEFALQEFAAVLAKAPATPRQEPWRRLSGITGVKGQRNLAVARELWLARDAFAREVDTAPGRLLPDTSIVAVSTTLPASKAALAGTKAFMGRASRTELDRWWQAIERGRGTDSLPELRAPREPGMLPNPKSWGDRNPEAAARLSAARTALAELSTELQVPVENLLSPDSTRRLSWQATFDSTPAEIGALLEELGCRPWQIEQSVQILHAAFVEAHQQLLHPVKADS